METGKDLIIKLYYDDRIEFLKELQLTKYRDVDKYLNETFPDLGTVLTRAFIWSKTIRGVEYWTNMHAKYEKET